MDIEITLKNYRCFPDSKPARINLRDGFTSFVGVNNSGKSSLLKFFYELRQLFQQWTPNNHALLQPLQGQLSSFSLVPTVFDVDELFANTNNRDMQIEIRLPLVQGQSKNANCLVANKVLFTVPRRSNTWKARVFTSESPYPNTAFSLGGAGDILLTAGQPAADISELLKAMNAISNTLYIGPFRNAVNVGSNDAYFDMQVGQGFISSWKNYKSGNLKTQNEACHRLTEDIKRIFAYNDLDISSSADERSLQVLIDGKSFKLPEVGSGLTQFIMVLATAAIRNPSFILIDEPELNLHPSLQLDFLTTLASYASLGIVFATHSLGLARGAADKIYSVRKLEPGVSAVGDLEATPHLAEFVGELSFSSYKELGFERILLVEGRSEVKTFQQFLRLLKKDHQVVLLPLAGSEMINAQSEAELIELTRISNRVSAVIDSELSDPEESLSAARQSFREACKRAKIDCKVLDRRATENYLSDRAVKRVKGPDHRALGPYQERETLAPMWAKTDNWRIAREMTSEELLSTDLGQFLERL